ncbi:MAG: class I SAM-dependent methyltransferase [Nocardioides sp.]
MTDSYEVYYESGYYDHRYPAPNEFTLGRVFELVPDYLCTPYILDIGAGSGRYAIPLAKSGIRVLAVERSTQARQQLQHRIEVNSLEDRIQLYSHLDEVPEELVKRSAVCLVLFGLLGHATYNERRSLISRLTELLPQNATISGSVPNRARRFRTEQGRALIVDSGGRGRRFRYSRTIAGRRCHFEYTAFSAKEVEIEMASMGWSGTQTWSESLFSEEQTVSNPFLQKFNRLTAHILPSDSGYCIYFESNRRRA